MNGMKPPKDPEPVSEFIRLLIERWEQDGKKLKDLASEAGLAKSMPSQIKARTSDASFYSARKLARPLGYADLPDLVHSAWAWWNSGREVVPSSHAEAPRAEAIRLAEGYGVTREQIERVLARWPLLEYEHKDALWWLSRFHEERTLDAEKHAEARAEKRSASASSRAAARKRAEIRTAKDAVAAATSASASARPASRRAS